MIKRFLASMLISCFFFPASAAAEDMSFTLMPTGAVRAEGSITNETLEKLELFSTKVDLTGRPVFLNSNGGAVEEALDIGRFLRKHKARTEIGKITDDGRVMNGVCQSACAYVFIGGASRKVSPGSYLTVHQIWIPENRKGTQQDPYTATDLSIVEKVVGDVAVYVSDMGISMKMLSVALHQDSWLPELRKITPSELKEFNIVTE